MGCLLGAGAGGSSMKGSAALKKKLGEEGASFFLL